jgi:phosphatidylserine synthase
MSTIDPRNVRRFFRGVPIPVNGTVVLFAGLLLLWQIVSL